jgi:hypothetical protein
LSNTNPTSAKLSREQQIIEDLAGLNPIKNPRIITWEGHVIDVYKVTSYCQQGKKFRVIPNGGKAKEIPLAEINSVETSS